jgi:hypothetical protein
MSAETTIRFVIDEEGNEVPREPAPAAPPPAPPEPGAKAPPEAAKPSSPPAPPSAPQQATRPEISATAQAMRDKYGDQAAQRAREKQTALSGRLATVPAAHRDSAAQAVKDLDEVIRELESQKEKMAHREPSKETLAERPPARETTTSKPEIFGNQPKEVTDPQRRFTKEQWEALGPDAASIAKQMRMLPPEGMEQARPKTDGSAGTQWVPTGDRENLLDWRRRKVDLRTEQEMQEHGTPERAMGAERQRRDEDYATRQERREEQLAQREQPGGVDPRRLWASPSLPGYMKRLLDEAIGIG